MKSLLDLIYKKRDAKELSSSEIQDFISSLKGKNGAPDYQVAALLSFIYCRGMSARETADLTMAMRNSGKQFCYSNFPKDALFIDKHSTGGVGDKISIPLAPLVIAASENIYIPMIAGRGLGHTGGTVDKLESIPGFNASPTLAQFYKLLKKHRCCLGSQTANIAPADRVLYALRDVTGTVPSIPLITASILSKKLSENLNALVLDVKFGSGAFMTKYEEALQLAQSLIDVAKLQDVPSTAVLSDMNTPLGHYSGHRVEIQESISILKNEGPPDSTELTKELATQMLIRSGQEQRVAQQKVNQALESGRAFEKWKEIIETQGGKLQDWDRLMKRARTKKVALKSFQSGYLKWNVQELGLSLIELGGGRKTKTDKIDFDVGLYHPVRTGDRVQKNQEILWIYYKDNKKKEVALRRLKQSFEIQEEAFSKPILIRKLIHG